jgi:hypothetical protein
LLAGMPARSKGGRRVPLGGVPQSGASGEAAELIGGLAEQFSTEFRERLQRQEEWQSRDEGLTTAKKRRTDLEPEISFEEDVFLQKVENAMANACRGFVMPAATAGSVGDIQSLRTEVKEDIARVQIHLTKYLAPRWNKCRRKQTSVQLRCSKA